ncbi:MAG TPA: hypothetical protein VEI83_01975 [Acidimicrobiales bacterium]|nr:hypothetical protein [Acidimicrobiales bacterium]
MSTDDHEPTWGWFLAWVGVGAGFTLGFLGAASIGLFVLPVAVVLAVVLARTARSAGSEFGVISGLGVPLFWIALRSGGWTPWYPWVIVGGLLVAGGIGLQLRRQRRARKRTFGTDHPRVRLG